MTISLGFVGRGEFICNAFLIVLSKMCLSHTYNLVSMCTLGIVFLDGVDGHINLTLDVCIVRKSLAKIFRLF